MMKFINEQEVMWRKQQLEIEERTQKLVRLHKWDHIKKVKFELMMRKQKEQIKQMQRRHFVIFLALLPMLIKIKRIFAARRERMVYQLNAQRLKAVLKVVFTYTLRRSGPDINVRTWRHVQR